MKATIDKAGRVVIPRTLREQVGFEPGEALEVTIDGNTIRLSRTAPGPRIDRKGDRLVARPTATREHRPEIDLEDLVRRERDRWPS